MADSLQKIDRLIEGQGKLAELTTHTQAQVEQVKETVEQVKETAEQAKKTVEQVKETVGQVKETVEQVKETVEQVKKTGDMTANGLAKLTVFTQEGLSSVHKVLTEYHTAITDLKDGQARIESTQNQILTLLQERLT